MAPAVPFALLGVVQLSAVAVWLALAGAVLFPRLRRRGTPVFVAGGLVMATADGLPAVHYGAADSGPLAWLRVAGLGLIALGALGGPPQTLVVPSTTAAAAIVVPLGARPTPAVAGGAVAVV